MTKIKRFIECLIPITTCNLRCSYCYVMQRNNRCNKIAKLNYSPEQIGNSLTTKRLGGICYFSICGAGETTLQPELKDIVYNILKQGHYVNITTNGTLTNKLKDIVKTSKEYISHLHFSFSLHYLELKKNNLLSTFFDNVRMVRDEGASILVQINLCDEYIPYITEINDLCIKELGFKPHAIITRMENKNLEKIKLHTNLSEKEYIEIGKKFNSKLFDFYIKNFNVKRKEFCYAGDWSFVLNLSTGIMRRCYKSYFCQNIFKDPNKKIKFLAIGNNCNSPYCMNCTHFMSLGGIPNLKTPTYYNLRSRDKNYNEETKKFLSSKLKDNNVEYKKLKKVYVNIVGKIDTLINFIVKVVKK